MKRGVAEVISDGRVTIPADIRDEFDLEEGDQIWVGVEPVEEPSGDWILHGD